jgi:hypothetical protein
MKNVVLLSMAIMLFWACSESENSGISAETEINKDTELTFEVVDSLAIEYLGGLRFCDISPDGQKYLFHDMQRGNFLITNKLGETLHEFIKTGDRPDLPPFVADNPVFLSYDKLSLLGPQSAYVYTLDGESLQIHRDEDPEKRRTINFTLPTKSVHVLRTGDKPHLIKGIQASGLNEESVEEKLEKWRAIDVTDPLEGVFQPLVELEPDSRFRDGAPYVSAMMRPIVSTSLGKVYVSFVQDPRVYVYDFDGQGFTKVEQIDLHPDLFFFDEPKPSDDFELGIRPSGAGRVQFIHGYENHLFTQYNPGVKAEDRLPAEVTRYPGGGVGTSSSSPSNLPADRFQYFVDGVKQGKDFEKQAFLGGVVMGEGAYLWFTRNTLDDQEESDYITFYKVRVVEKN